MGSIEVIPSRYDTSEPPAEPRPMPVAIPLRFASRTIMELVTYEELREIYAVTERVNQLLTETFDQIGVELVDFKIEFGRLANGELVLADEISPDTCRLWDRASGDKLDKDRFRRDLGRVREAYEEVLRRLKTL